MVQESTIYSTGKIYRMISFLTVLICFGFASWAYPQLPEQVPSHWNFAGEIDGYSGRFSGAFLLPSIMLALLAFTYVIPRIDPKKSNFKFMGKVYWLSISAVILFLGALYSGIIVFSLGMVKFNIVPIIIHIGLGLLFIVIGTYLPKVKYNFMFGFRTPWTLANEDVWNKTHRFMGPVLIIIGIIIMVARVLTTLWFKANYPVLIPLLLVIPLISMIYSYVISRKLT